MPKKDAQRLVKGIKDFKKPAPAPRVKKTPAAATKTPGVGFARRNLMKQKQKEPPSGWKVVVKVRRTGASAGTRDCYYIGPAGETARSMREVNKIIGSER